MSVTKLMSCIVAPSDDVHFDAAKKDNIDSLLHHRTYGISSDPLTQFACVFAALIHDVSTFELFLRNHALALLT